MSDRGDQIHIHIQFSRRNLERIAKIGIVSALLGAPVALLASTVSLPFAFSSGDPVSAAEMNANFQALRDAINDNQAQITSIFGKRVFVSSDLNRGDFGGVEGADEHCQNLADAAGLYGTYLAWLATDGGPAPADRFTQSGVAYRLVDGTLVANGWSDLTDGSLVNPITVDESGEDVGSYRAFTNVNQDGTADGDSDCEGWTADGGAVGVVGATTGVDATWTNSLEVGCATPVHIYCFQQ